MPTNLKNLLSRSRSRNELKLSRTGGEETSLEVPCCGGKDGGGCGCRQNHSATPSPALLRREPSCKSLFSPIVSRNGAEDDSDVLSDDLDTSTSSSSRLHPPSPTTTTKSSTCCEMRKCETVLALSSFAASQKMSGPGSPSSSTSKVKGMKDKILSTSSSTLNSLIHSSSRTTSKLFSAWKLSSGSSTSNLSSGSSSARGKTTNIVRSSRSQLSIHENEEDSGVDPASGPLTPMNRLRRNVSFTASANPQQSYCLLGSKYSSLSSLVCQENEEDILCRLCLTVVKVEDTVDFSACSCRYCKDCVEAYVNFEIQEGAYDIACPDATCEKQGILTQEEIEHLVSPPMMSKHQKFRLYREVEKDSEVMWCPSPGCDTVCQIHETGGEKKIGGGGETPRRSLSIKCSTCQKSFCAECKLSFHPDASCESYRRKLVKEGKLSGGEEEDLSKIESIKKCPFCHVPIEKDSGCAQMMCKRCNHVFCWYCLASLDDDFLLRHYDKGPCKNKLGHSRASVIWHRAQVIGIFAGFGVLVLLASPLLILVAPCLLCCRCGYCANRLPDEFPASV